MEHLNFPLLQENLTTLVTGKSLNLYSPQKYILMHYVWSGHSGCRVMYYQE